MISHKSGMAQSLQNIGDILILEGNLNRAKKTLQESLALGRETGERSLISGALQNLAGVLAALGDLDGAKKTYEQVLAIRREIGEKSGLAFTLGARKLQEESLAYY